ncbi:MAG: metallophosphoesterase [Deltaproteobacteria bacterium]|nr:metallophosphoesterase [Deltaproteobacteria bacterium]
MRLSSLALVTPLLLLSLLSAACSSSDPDSPATSAGSDAGLDADATACDEPARFPSTADKTFVTSLPRKDDDGALALGKGPAADPAVRDQLEKDGFGATKEASGESWVVRAPNGVTPPSGTCSRRIARFAHLADLQLADDESPNRLAAFDAPIDAFRSASRAQEGELCALADEAVRTINAIHAKAPLDFLLLGGDNIDSAQSNELDWVLSILDGQKGLKCDSASSNDPIAGPANDGKDVFDAEGAKMPWYWVNGNHDVLVQGNVAILDEKGVMNAQAAAAVGTMSSSGTRDYTKAGAPVVTGKVEADSKRQVLTGAEILRRVAEKTGGPGPVGHGIGAEQVKSGRAHYTFDFGSKLRVFVWDSTAPVGGDEGIVYKSELDAVFKPALDKARADGKWVILAAHHGTDRITLDAGTFGRPRVGALTAQEFIDFVAGYPNVIASLVGHEHQHKTNFRFSSKDPTKGFWEIATSAIADWPQQLRVLEVFDEGAGWARIRATVVDVDWSTASAAAKLGRTRSTIDYTSGWSGGGGSGGGPEHRNVDLWIKPPM